MIEFFTTLTHYEFLQKALITSLVVGIVCGIIGSFIVLRGIALIGDAISHAVLPGVAASYLIGINFFWGAVVVGLLATFAIGFISEQSRVKNDSAIGIVFSAFFAALLTAFLALVAAFFIESIASPAVDAMLLPTLLAASFTASAALDSVSVTPFPVLMFPS